MNEAPHGQRELPAGFLDFFLPLHRRFTPRQQVLVEERLIALAAAHRGLLPQHESTNGPARKLPRGGSNCRNGAPISATR
jgi:hypothetical protein